MWSMSDHGSHKKISHGLVALSSAAVLAVYSAGYLRTKAAADRFTLQAEARRPVIRVPAGAAPAKTPVLPSPSATTGAASSPATPPPVEKPSSIVRRSGNTTKSQKAVRAPRPSVGNRQTETTSTIPASPAPVATLEIPAAAVEHAAAIPLPVVPDPPKAQYKDGTYFGWGTSRHGDIQAQVLIENGRIASATIAQCLTRYSCSVIAKLPPQVAERQSPETDYVSGATQSTNAFYYAVVEALSKAK